MKSSNKGFGVVEIVIIAIAILVIGLVGWKVWSMMNAPKPAEQTPPSLQEVNNASDLEKVDNALDTADIEGDEVKQLDAEANF